MAAQPYPICYLNGSFLPLEEARISPLDRGFLFADSVYEVLPAFSGRMFRFREHFDRLARSLAEICIAPPLTHREWHDVLNELIRRNGGGDMYLYVQVSRGMELGRDHTFPAQANPTVFAMACPLPVLTDEMRERGLAAITVEDFRWGRCDIKSTMLLANVLMKQRAKEAGAQEAIIVSNGEVLEGASTSVFLVIEGTIVTPPDSRRILPGTTRDAALEVIGEPVQRRRVSTDELVRAREIWLSAATRDVLPVTRIDGKPVGDGKPGPRWREVNERLLEMRKRLANTPALDGT
ncbi:MAG TPA: D-amino acid aminotransferase [Steroidobacteraceae bacterium]